MAGRVVCAWHATSGFGRAVSEEVRARALREPAGADGVTRRDVVREFQRRIELGEYAALFAGRLRDAIGDAGRGPGYSDELNAMKATLWRLMEDDRVGAVKLAHAVSRLVGATVRAKKADLALAKLGGDAGFEGRLAELLKVLGDKG